MFCCQCPRRQRSESESAWQTESRAELRVCSCTSQACRAASGSVIWVPRQLVLDRSGFSNAESSDGGRSSRSARRDMGNSPYQCYSAFAGNPDVISPELLLEDGLITPAEETQ